MITLLAISWIVGTWGLLLFVLHLDDRKQHRRLDLIHSRLNALTGSVRR